MNLVFLERYLDFFYVLVYFFGERCVSLDDF